MLAPALALVYTKTYLSLSALTKDCFEFIVRFGMPKSYSSCYYKIYSLRKLFDRLWDHDDVIDDVIRDQFALFRHLCLESFNNGHIQLNPIH